MVSVTVFGTGLESVTLIAISALFPGAFDRSMTKIVPCSAAPPATVTVRLYGIRPPVASTIIRVCAGSRAVAVVALVVSIPYVLLFASTNRALTTGFASPCSMSAISKSPQIPALSCPRPNRNSCAPPSNAMLRTPSGEKKNRASGR
jgi:hypothetical protein